MTNAPLISILHPTARVRPYPSFPRGWRAACEQFFFACADPHHVEYVLIVHESRWEELWRAELATEFQRYGVYVVNYPAFTTAVLKCPEWGSVRVVRNTGRDCVVDQINAGATVCSGQLLIGIMDDLEAPLRWDTRLIDEIVLADFPNLGDVPDLSGYDLGASEHVVDLTGEPTEHIVYGAVTRARYEKQGFILHPEFDSMFADNHLSHCAWRDGVIINGRRVGFKHNHPTNGRTESDEVYAQQNSAAAYRQGYATFKKLTEGTRSIAFLIPGEWFSHRVMFGLFDVMEYLWTKGFIVERFGAHTSNVYATRIELADAALTVGVKSDFILSVDDDNVLTPENLDMLIADADKHPGIDIFTGWSWCDTGDYENNPFRMSCGRQGPNLECQWFTVEDYVRMKAAGTLAITSDDIAPDAFWSGFPVILMRRSVMEKLGWEAFLPMLGKDFRRGFTSEDTTFFNRAHQSGIKSAVDLRVKVPHLKLRAIEPQILPASERAEVMKMLDRMEQELESASVRDG